MQLTLFGLSHHSAPVEIREQWGLSSQRSRELLGEFRSSSNAEHLIVSTCNRTEFYRCEPYKHALSDNARQQSLAFAAQVRHLMNPDLSAPIPLQHYYIHRDRDAVRHLFRLAAGLDSALIGESEILRQLRAALKIAVESDCAREQFTRLVPAALRVGKRVRTETKISRGSMTLGQAALQLCRKALGKRQHLSLLVVGSGAVARAAARAFMGEVQECVVVNRTLSRAQDLVRELGAERAIGWSSIETGLASADVVLASTSSDHLLLKRSQIERIQMERGQRPFVLVDLAVPRDVDPECRAVPGVHLLNIDDLNAVVRENALARRGEVPDAEDIVTQAIESFESHSSYLQVEPVIRHLLERFEEIRLGEMQAFTHRFPPQCHTLVDELTTSLVRKLQHFPIQKLKSLRSESGLKPDEIALIRRLFREQV